MPPLRVLLLQQQLVRQQHPLLHQRPHIWDHRSHNRRLRITAKTTHRRLSLIQMPATMPAAICTIRSSMDMPHCRRHRHNIRPITPAITIPTPIPMTCTAVRPLVIVIIMPRRLPLLRPLPPLLPQLKRPTIAVMLPQLAVVNRQRWCHPVVRRIATTAVPVAVPQQQRQLQPLQPLRVNSTNRPVRPEIQRLHQVPPERLVVNRRPGMLLVRHRR